MELTSKIKLHFERFEFKYIMRDIEADQVLETMLKNNLEFDPYAKNNVDNTYTVTSLYYDSPTLKCYREKIDGVSRRFKLRERIYSERLKENEPIFYEIKNKKDAVIVKDRQIGAPSPDFLYRRRRFNMEPNVLVTYKRRALQGKFQDRLRVTFDSSLRAAPGRSLADFDELVDIAPGLVIMEVKYNGTLPGWFKRIITWHELNRQPFSKYCAGVESCPSIFIKTGLWNRLDTRTLNRSRAIIFV